MKAELASNFAANWNNLGEILPPIVIIGDAWREILVQIEIFDMKFDNKILNLG